MMMRSKNGLVLIFLLFVLLYLQTVSALPVPTVVIGEFEGIDDALLSMHVDVTAYEGGSNFTKVVTWREANVDLARKLFGTVLTSDIRPDMDIVVRADGRSLLYRYSGTQIFYGVAPNDHQEFNFTLSKNLIFVSPTDEVPSSGGSGGGGSGGGSIGEIIRPPADDGDTQRDSFPPIDPEYNQSGAETQYNDSRDVFNEAYEVKKEKEAVIIREMLQHIIIYISVIVLLSLFILIRLFMFFFPKGAKQFIMEWRVRLGIKLDRKTIQWAHILKIAAIALVLIVLLLLLAMRAQAVKTPQPVRGSIYGPDKIGAFVNISAYNAATGTFIDNTTAYAQAGANPFYLGVLSLDNPPTYRVWVNASEDNTMPFVSFGSNTTVWAGHSNGTEIILNIVLHADLNITSPTNLSYNNITFFNITWDYPNNDWMVFDVEIDDNSDFSSPVYSWTVNETNYTMHAGQALPDDTYYLRVRSYDDQGHLYIDSQTVEFVVDTVDPVITGINYVNETWLNTNVTYQVSTNEDAFCKLDFTPGTSYISKPITFSTAGATHSYTTSFTSQGNYTYYIQCIDLAGNILDLANEEIFQLRFDSYDPTTTHNYTWDNVWTNEDALIGLTVTDPLPTSSIFSTRYCVGAGCNPQGGTGVNYVNPLAYSEGDRILRFQSRDVAGNLESVNQISIRIDQTAPNTFDNYASNNVWVNGDRTITITPRDTLLASNSGVAWTRYCTDTTNSCTPGTSYTVPITFSAENITYLRYHSNDTAGNVQSIVTRIVKIDKTPPTCSGASVNIEGGLNYIADTTLDFTYSGFTDSLSGLLRYHYNYADTANYVNPDADLTGQLGSAAQGNVSIFVWAEDNVNNLGCSVRDWIVVDTVAPIFNAHDSLDVTEKSSGVLTVNTTITDATTWVQGLPTIRYRYAAGAWSGYVQMTDEGSGVYSYDIPEFPGGWNLLRNEDVFWEVNVSDYLVNKRTSTLQSEHIDSINDNPVLFTISNTSVNALNLLTFWIDAIDPDNDGIETQDLTFGVNETNISITKFNDTRALVAWNPSNSWITGNMDTNHTFNFTVRDDGIPAPVLYDWQLVTIQVNFTNEPPVMDPIGNKAVAENATLVFDVNATDPNGHVVTYYDNTTLFDIDPVNGTVYYVGKAGDVGSYSVLISASDYEYNDTEVINFTVVNVQNNLTFIMTDRIFNYSIQDVTLVGGHSCAANCTFNGSITITEPDNPYTYDFIVPGFTDYSMSLGVLSTDQIFEIDLNDTEAPSMLNMPIVDHILSQYYENFTINTTGRISDNTRIKNVTYRWARYNKDQALLYEYNNTNMSLFAGDMAFGSFNASIGAFSESFVLVSNITVYDYYDNVLAYPLYTTQFIYIDPSLISNRPPTLLPIGNQYLFNGEDYEYQAVAYDFDFDNLTFSDNTTLFEINETSGYINFTPQSGDAGTHFVNISVTDGNATDFEIVRYVIDRGNNVTFNLFDSTLNQPVGDAYIQGGRECAYGCYFDQSISLIEASDDSTYMIRATGFNTTYVSFASVDNMSVDVFMDDTEPAQVSDINITVRLIDDNSRYMVDVVAALSDNVGPTGAEFIYNITQADNASIIGTGGSFVMNDMGGNMFNGTFGPFETTVNIASNVTTYDLSGNIGRHKNALRNFFFFQGNIIEKKIVIAKNIRIINQSLYAITYELTDEIFNSANQNISNVQFRDTDIDNAFMYLDIEEEKSVKIARNVTLSKTATGLIWNTVSASVTYAGDDYYSNAPSIAVPGFGGPFDLLLYPTSTQFPSEANLTFGAYLENMNPQFGQDAVLTYWLEDDNGTLIDRSTETLFVQSLSSINVPRGVSTFAVTEPTTVFLYANITWTMGQAAFAARTLQLVAPTCSDGVKNQGEDSPDCGGPCPECPTCVDGKINQEESGIDCGGPNCDPCVAGLQCNTAFDCQSLRCISGYCFPATCSDGIKNQGESDVDCGGPCPSCGPLLRCNYATDCQSGICDNGYCGITSDTCSDGMKNNGETDIDCGGPCQSCPSGNACLDGNDCISGNCVLDVCMPATCFDGIQNQNEKGIDCGGSCMSCIIKDLTGIQYPEGTYEEIADFTTTTVYIDDGSNQVSMSKFTNKNVVKKDEEFTIQNIIRYHGYGIHDLKVKEVVPNNFEVSVTNYSRKYSEGNYTVIEWEGTISELKSYTFGYTLKYKENKEIRFDIADSIVQESSDVVKFKNPIVILSARNLVENMKLQKLINYDETTTDAKVTLTFENTGEVDLYDITINELIPEGAKIISDHAQEISPNKFALPKLLPGESFTIAYEGTGIALDEIIYMPEAYGIPESSINSELVLNSGRTLLQTVVFTIKLIIIIIGASIVFLIFASVKYFAYKDKAKSSKDILLWSFADMLAGISHSYKVSVKYIKETYPKAKKRLKELLRGY